MRLVLFYVFTFLHPKDYLMAGSIFELTWTTFMPPYLQTLPDYCYRSGCGPTKQFHRDQNEWFCQNMKKIKRFMFFDSVIIIPVHGASRSLWSNVSLEFVEKFCSSIVGSETIGEYGSKELCEFPVTTRIWEDPVTIHLNSSQMQLSDSEKTAFDDLPVDVLVSANKLINNLRQWSNNVKASFKVSKHNGTRQLDFSFGPSKRRTQQK